MHDYLAADNALSFDVITAAGEYATANADSNPDLFWALKGGGPSAFAAILSVTFQTFIDLPSAGVIIDINSTLTTDTDVFWNGVRTFHNYSNHFVDNGLYGYFELMALRLHVRPLVGIGKTAADMDAIVKPLLDELDSKSVPYTTETAEYNTFYELYIGMFEDETAGNSALTGGWMFAHEDVATNNDAIVDAFEVVLSPREDLADQGYIIGHIWDAGHGTPIPNSATNPKFRNASSFCITALPVPIGATWAQKEDLQNVLTNIQDEAMRQAGPNGCAYVNEVSTTTCLHFITTSLHPSRATLISQIGRITFGGRSIPPSLQQGRFGTPTACSTLFPHRVQRTGRLSTTVQSCASDCNSDYSWVVLCQIGFASTCFASQIYLPMPRVHTLHLEYIL
jgi:hypothetical protein